MIATAPQPTTNTETEFEHIRDLAERRIRFIAGQHGIAHADIGRVIDAMHGRSLISEPLIFCAAKLQCGDIRPD